MKLKERIKSLLNRWNGGDMSAKPAAAPSPVDSVVRDAIDARFGKKSQRVVNSKWTHLGHLHRIPKIGRRATPIERWVYARRLIGRGLNRAARRAEARTLRIPA